MSLKRHINLTGKHATLSPSNYHWLNYDEEKLRRVFFQQQEVARGTKLHAFAQQAIELGVKLPDTQATLNAYINDAIGFHMEAEVPLVYTEDCFGTADACGFRNNTLRIHDLKTGVNPASMTQLMIYAALFFFMYSNVADPKKVKVILRIYQNDKIEEFIPDVEDILAAMEKVEFAARLIAYLREED